MGYLVPRMNTEESRAWVAVIGMAELLPTALDAQLQAESGMTHFEFQVLSVLKNANDNTLRIKELAAASNATLPRLSKVVSRLEERQLVEKNPDTSDGRAIAVHLTTTGRKALVLAVPGHIALARDLVIDRLTPEQLEAIAAAFEPIIARLDPQQRLGVAARSR